MWEEYEVRENSDRWEEYETDDVYERRKVGELVCGRRGVLGYVDPKSADGKGQYSAGSSNVVALRSHSVMTHSRSPIRVV